jgi:fatty acid desaturase
MTTNSMGEARRRSEQGLPPRVRQPKEIAPKDTSPRLAPWLPLTRQQADRFVALTTRGAWIGIAALVLFWVTVRFIGPAAGWWTLAD